MRRLLQRAWFSLSLALGRLLRAARYANAHVVGRDGAREVRKRRALFAPLLVLAGRPLMKFLDTGVRVLPQGEWAAREREMYRILYATDIRIETDGTLVLPFLAGTTLATLLEQQELDGSARRKAIACAVVALAELHRAGLTHGDAMAENVMIDVEAGVGRWFDFETVHEPGRAMDRRRADDLRALLATCLLRTAPPSLTETVDVIVDTYDDRAVTRLLAQEFVALAWRPLPFHLGQAPLSSRQFNEIGGVLRERLAG